MPGLGIGAGSAFRQGLLVNRPSAEPSLEGYFYFATDDNGGTFYQCDGSSWVPITGGNKSVVAGANISIISTPTTITISGTAAYSLPIASSSVLGGIKVGANLSIDGSGILSGSAPYTLPIASASVLGGVKQGSNITIDGSGFISASGNEEIEHNGANIGSRPIINLIDGANVTLTVADNSGSNRVDVTVASASGLSTGAITFEIFGYNGAIIATGIAGDLRIPFACTITKVTMLSDTTTNAVVDIWKSGYSGYPPTSGGSITASHPPTLSSASKSQDSTLTGWTTAISAGDILRFNTNSCSAASRIVISLDVTG